ncbi:helix-turn-helix transcriptional regulator [Umezawaea sp. Da 62-37]|uniref:helix-turn-helix domain-containing protein n=1 Tax=Umezawaea sp. Da 62-37 TaxID=3075927 RepID=UPI0028F74840|nr:helix-turn-helix transcriptional regulator [Umezawaea sp. Da 62-37]WNV88261.1 helix-turn-helix transcriptional regulator [Umezawaea sp. Da 62-37]
MPRDDKHPSARLSSAHSRELGEELRRVRVGLGIKASTLCEEVGWSSAKLSKLEGGTRGACEADVATLLGFYRADKAVRARVLELVKQSDRGCFVRAHHDASPDDVLCARMHEAVARTLTCYQPLLLPSLLRSKAYAEALLGHAGAGGEQRDSRLGHLAARQEVLHRESAPEAVVFIHEAALHLVVGGPAVMHDQCMRLCFMADRARLGLRVVPMSAGHPALRCSATLLTFAEPLKPLAFSETATATAFFDEDTAIAAVRRKFAALGAMALGVEESRAVFRRWAVAYDTTDPRSGTVAAAQR